MFWLTYDALDVSEIFSGKCCKVLVVYTLMRFGFILNLFFKSVQIRMKQNTWIFALYGYNPHGWSTHLRLLFQQIYLLMTPSKLRAKMKIHDGYKSAFHIWEASRNHLSTEKYKIKNKKWIWARCKQITLKYYH